MYRNQIETLAKTLEFDLNVFLDFLKTQQKESGLGGWRSMLPGVNEMVHGHSSHNCGSAVTCAMSLATGPTAEFRNYDDRSD